MAIKMNTPYDVLYQELKEKIDSLTLENPNVIQNLKNRSHAIDIITSNNVYDVIEHITHDDAINLKKEISGYN